MLTLVPNAMSDNTDLLLRRILTDVLGLQAGQADSFDTDTGLFGHLPELDSMAVAGLLTELEDRLDIVIDDFELLGKRLGRAEIDAVNRGGTGREWLLNKLSFTMPEASFARNFVEATPTEQLTP